MRITHLLYLSQKPDQNPLSGAEIATTELALEFARAGVPTELLVIEWNSGPLIDARLAELAGEGVTVTRVVRRQRGWPGNRWARAIGCWIRLARELRRPRDLVHLHLDLVVAPILCRLGRVRWVVATVHNDEPGYGTWWWRLWSAVLNRLVTRFVAVSDRVASYYATACALPTGSVPVIRHPVRPVADDPDLIAALRPARAAFVIGCVGRLTEQKDPLLLAAVLQRAPTWHGVLVGEGPERARVERFVAAHGMTNLRLAGAIPGVRRGLRAFDVLVLPSRWEGLGLVLVEAMLAGVLVVGSRAGAIPETLGSGRFGLLFEPGSVDALHAALRQVAERRVDVAAITASARSDAERRYAPAAIREQMLRLYRSLSDA